MRTSVLEKAKTFDKSGAVEIEIDNAVGLLRSFRAKYPFAENLKSIETLDPDDIFKEQTSEVGDFFHWLEYRLKPIGHLTLYSNVYRQIRSQFEDFKELLYVVVDKEKSLAEKVDAPWREILGMGGDSHIAKKIIFCFNFETELVIPIFSTGHLEFFLHDVIEGVEFPVQYENMSLGEKYEFLTSEILKIKESSQVTKPWEITYFCRFLYDTYPPPQIDSPIAKTRGGEKIKTEQQQEFGEFMKLLTELQGKSKISGEEFRLNRKLWEDYPENRESLVERLRLLLNK